MRANHLIMLLCMAMSALIAPAAAAADLPACPACPPACVAHGLVQSFKSGMDVRGSCPKGCVLLLGVKSFLDEPLCQIIEAPDAASEKQPPLLPPPVTPLAAPGQTPAPSQAEPAEPARSAQPAMDEHIRTPAQQARPAPAAGNRGSAQTGGGGPVPYQYGDTGEGKPLYLNTYHRMILSPTAVGVPKGHYAITGYAAGLWELQYGYNDHIQLGVITILPVFVAGAFPTVKFQTQVGDHLHLAAGVTAGVFGMFSVGDFFGYAFGGSLHLTYAKGPHTFNTSVIGGSLGYVIDGDSEAPWMGGLLATMGYRYGFAKNWSFQVEGVLPIPLWRNMDDTDDYQDYLHFLLFYGFRGHSDLLFGDIGFCFPATRVFLEYLWQYAPLGFPYFSIGFTF